MIELFFLGVGSSSPRPEWGMPGIVIRRKGEIFVFDCGEGFQVSYLQQRLPINSPMRILITHLHGDHFFGLMPFLQTLALQGRKKPLEVYGPKGLEDCLIEGSMERNYGSYEVKVFEIGEGTLLSTEEYTIRAIKANHSTESFSYVFQEKPMPGKFLVDRAEELGIPEGYLRKLLQKGKNVVVKGKVITPKEVLGPPREGISVLYSGDTAYNPILTSEVNNIDILIHETTFSVNEKEEASESLHSTTKDAAKTALSLKAKVLFMIHFSSRYKDLSFLEKEAREVFRRSYLTYKGLKVVLKRAYEPVKSLDVTFMGHRVET